MKYFLELKNQLVFLLFTALIFLAAGCQENFVSVENLSVELNESEGILFVLAGENKLQIPVTGFWEMEGCTLTDVRTTQTKDKLRITKNWTYQNREFVTTEILTANKGSINWKFTIKDDNKGLWSTGIITNFNYPSGQNTSYWSAWSDPRQGSLIDLSREDQIEKGIIVDAIKVNDWADPLISIPFQNAKLWYGEEPYSLDIKFRMFGIRNPEKYITAIPMLSVFEKEQDLGLTFVQSIDDILLNVSIETTEEGDVLFKRENYRLGDGVEQSFSMDIIPHDGGLLSGLKGVTLLYPEYFEPANPKVREVEGMFSYSRNWGDFDKEKYKKMGFKTCWKASHDLPWMGMFIPPVDDEEIWQGFERNKGSEDDFVSIPKMRQFSENMVADGFRVLNYMNVCEFGAYITPETPEGIDDIPEEDVWKDANAYLYRNLSDAILRRTWRGDAEGKPDKFWSWRKCIALDCGIPSYQNYLIDQVKRHIKEFPASSGFNVDRLDWLRIYNLDSDDGISWFENQPVRSLNVSYKELMEKLWPILQENNKSWLLDPNGARIDFMNRADGIIEEINEGQVLNVISFMTLKKPTAAWIHQRNMEGKSNEEREVWFQNYLYLGIWPMAPFLENDHSLLPDPEIDLLYLEYAPLFKTLYGKEWVLESHIIKKSKDAKVNIFKTDLGYSIPVMFTSKGKKSVSIEVKKEYLEGKTIEIFHPAESVPVTVNYEINGEYGRVEVPVSKRCAMVVIR